MGVDHDQGAGARSDPGADPGVGPGALGQVVAEVGAEIGGQALEQGVGGQVVHPLEHGLAAPLEPFPDPHRESGAVAVEQIDTGHQVAHRPGDRGGDAALGQVEQVVQDRVLALEQLRVLAADVDAGVGEDEMAGVGGVEAGEDGPEGARELQADGEQCLVRAAHPGVLEVDPGAGDLVTRGGIPGDGVGEHHQFFGQARLALAADPVPVEDPVGVARLAAVEGAAEARGRLLAVAEGAVGGEGLGGVRGLHGPD